MSNHLTQKVVAQWLEAAWREGGGEGDTPDFSLIDPRKLDQKSKPDPKELSTSPHDPSRCDARVWNSGWGKQCNSKKSEGCSLCKSHQTKFEKVHPDGLDLGLGRYNAERPTHSRDKSPDDPKYLLHDWADIRKTGNSPNKAKRVSAKLMREKLTELGVSIDGLSYRALTDRFNEVIQDRQ